MKLAFYVNIFAAVSNIATAALAISEPRAAFSLGFLALSLAVALGCLWRGWR